MRPMNLKNVTLKNQLFVALMVAVTLLLTPAAFAATPGITSTASTPGTFNLTAQDGYLNQPDGEAVYSWGYGCVSGSAPVFVPATITGAYCNTMQVPGPTLVVTEGSTVTVNLTNNLPTAAGNTSIVLPGFQVTATGGVLGLLAQEAAPGTTVTYSFTATVPGTHSYYSGTQSDLQIEMGLYGAVIVLPKNPPANCANVTSITNLYGKTDYGTATGIPGFPESDFRLSTAAYDHPKSCYDREYLFQWAEMDTRIHRQAQAQVTAKIGCTAGAMATSLPRARQPRAHPGTGWEPDSEPHQSYPKSGRHSDVQHGYHSGRGIRRNFLLQRQGIELGSVRSSSRRFRQHGHGVADQRHHRGCQHGFGGHWLYGYGNAQ